MLHPDASQRLGTVLRHATDDAIVLVIGPEGGFSDEELEAAKASGVRLARLGPFVLRTETACAAALGAALALGELTD